MSERRVRVRLGSRSYTVTVASGLVDEAGSRTRAVLGKGPKSAMIVSNPTVWALYGERTVAGFERAGFRVVPHLIGDGERFKRLTEVERAVGAAASAELERSEPVVALGGGVVGDLAGLVAAMYMRGTPLVQIPTTLLAQIDSSVGGKVAVNHPAGKNLIGAFHQPAAVYADPATLATLPARELRAGLYEAIKYGVLGDESLFDWLGRRLESLLAADASDLARLTERCCRIKARIVEEDERESGVRRFLNLGHTSGHALESVTRYRRFTHGEAVGYGLEVAAELATGTKLLGASEAARIRDLVRRVGRRPRVDDLDANALVDAMRHDKKRAGGNVGFVLPRSVGRVEWVARVDERDVRRALARALDSKQT